MGIVRDRLVGATDTLIRMYAEVEALFELTALPRARLVAEEEVLAGFHTEPGSEHPA